MLIEMLEENNIHIISANTDGIVSLFDKSKIDLYYKICQQWEKIVGNDTLGQLEYQEYKKLIQLSVNDYLAITIDNKIKQKGDFMTDFELHKNKSFKIIPIALKEYYVNNIPIEETIKNHKNIFDFCAGIKSKAGWYYQIRQITNGQLERKNLQKTNRYYIAKKGGILYKMNTDGREQFVNAHPLKGRAWKTVIFNKFEEGHLENIDYSFYIRETNKIIESLTQKLTLF